jgi:hypothetical protein
MKSYGQKPHTPYCFLLCLLALMIPISASAADIFAAPKQAKRLIGSVHKQVNACIIDGHTYLKLREMAELFSDTEKCFDVGWDDQNRAVTFINHWAAWRPPCGAKLPEFQALYDQYKDSHP